MRFLCANDDGIRYAKSMAIAGSPPNKRWTASEVERLIASGAIERPERYELLAGELREKMGQNAPHIACIDLCTEALRAVYGAGFLLRSGSPVKGLLESEPEPDLMVLRGTARELAGRTPAPEDILLLVEVADSSWPDDVREKVPLYARLAGRELWVLDVRARRVQVYRSPRAATAEWGETSVLGPGEMLTPPQAAGSVAVADLFPQGG